MPVVGHRVRFHIFVHFREMGGQGEPPPRAGHPRLGIDNDAGRIHPPGLQQRHDGQQRRRGIASGIAHDPGLADAAAMEFSQPVDSFIQQARARVRGMIPLLIHLGVFESEVGAQVHDARVIDQGRGQLHRLPRGQGEEDDIGLARHTRWVDGSGAGGGEPPQVRIQVRHGLALPALRPQVHQLDSGMRYQQARQLPAAVARCPQNGGPDRHADNNT